MSWLAIAGILTAMAATTAVIVFPKWESILADPSMVFRTLADNIESDPNRIKNLLYQISDDIITPAKLEMPLAYVREFLEVMLNQTSDTWQVPKNIVPATETPKPYYLTRKIEDAVTHRVVFKSMADNIAQGSNAVASMIEALRTMADRIDAGETEIMDITIDLGMALTSNIPVWTDVRTGILLPRSSGLTPSQKQERDDIFQLQFGEAVAKETCMIGSRGVGYEDFVISGSVYNSSNSCTLTNSELVTQLNAGLASRARGRAAALAKVQQAKASTRRTSRKVPY